MANLTIAAADVAVVQWGEAFTAPLGEDAEVGEMMRIDVSTGKLTPGNASTAAEARVIGMLVSKSGGDGNGTVLRKGIVDVGEALAGLTLDDDVYLSDTDGTLADSAGTVSTIVAKTVSGFAGATVDRLLRLDL